MKAPQPVGAVAAPPAKPADGGLMTWRDVELRWQPPGDDPYNRQKWLQRKAQAWGLRPLDGTRGASARFRFADVLRAEARAAGEGRV